MDKEKPKKKKKRSSKLPVFVTYTEYAEMILPHIRSRHHKVAVMLAFESGLRISEVIALKQKHIDMEQGVISVIGGKGNKDRFTILPVHWLPEHMKYVPIQCSKRALQKSFEIACERSGLYKIKPTIHFHSLRHGWATFCHEQGIEIEWISKGLGHSDISTTMIYTHLAKSRLVKKLKEAWV